MYYPSSLRSEGISRHEKNDKSGAKERAGTFFNTHQPTSGPMVLKNLVVDENQKDVFRHF